MGNHFIEQIEYGLSQISQKDKNYVIRSIAITRPHKTPDFDPGAYLKIDWMTTEAPTPQPYGTPIYPAGNIAEIEAEIYAAAVHFGVRQEDINKTTFGDADDPDQKEAFSNRGRSLVTEEEKIQLFEIHEPEDLIDAAMRLGWRRWAFKPAANI